MKAADVAGKSLKVATVQGQPISVDGSFGVRVNEAHVIQPDIETSNGVIHVIDTILLPPARAEDASLSLLAISYLAAMAVRYDFARLTFPLPGHLPALLSAPRCLCSAGTSSPCHPS